MMNLWMMKRAIHQESLNTKVLRVFVYDSSDIFLEKRRKWTQMGTVGDNFEIQWKLIYIILKFNGN